MRAALTLTTAARSGNKVQITEREAAVIPARQQAALDRVLAFVSKHCDEVRVTWAPIGPYVEARPKAMIDIFGEPMAPPHQAELDAPDMIAQGIARSVEVEPRGLVVETPMGMIVCIRWLHPRGA